MNPTRFTSTITLLASLCTCPCVVRAQDFESTSIKQHLAPGPGAGLGIHVNGTQITAIATPLVMFIMYAYDVPRGRISGAPRWTILGGEQSYDFEATIGDNPAPSPDEVRAMLRRFLAERFQLQIHRENAAEPVCALSIAEGGPHLRESPPPDSKPVGLAPESSTEGVHLIDDVATLKLFRSSLARLAAVIRTYVQCRTVDQTGLGGIYDINLSWRVSSLDVQRSRPAFLAALAEQLGLRVDPLRTDSVEMLVIDRVVQPPPN